MEIKETIINKMQCFTLMIRNKSIGNLTCAFEEV